MYGKYAFLVSFKKGWKLSKMYKANHCLSDISRVEDLIADK